MSYLSSSASIVISSSRYFGRRQHFCFVWQSCCLKLGRFHLHFNQGHRRKLPGMIYQQYLISLCWTKRLQNQFPGARCIIPYLFFISLSSELWSIDDKPKYPMGKQQRTSCWAILFLNLASKIDLLLTSYWIFVAFWRRRASETKSASELSTPRKSGLANLQSF